MDPEQDFETCAHSGCAVGTTALGHRRAELQDRST